MRSVNSENNVVSKILRNVVLILFLVIFVSIVYNFGNRESATESALMTDATASAEFRGVFIRDEEVVTYNGGGVLSYGVTEGGRLGNGSVIAQVYQDDRQIKTNREIEKLSRELDILKKIQNPGTIESAQPASLSEDIEETYRNLIYCRDMHDYETIGTDMDNLLVMLSTYQIVTEEDVDFSQRIVDIGSELNQLKLSTIYPTEMITSDRSAYFVSYCDGYEDILTKENISSLTVSQLDGITEKVDNDPRIVGKLIDGYEWYLAGVINNSRKEYAVGDKVQLRFESASETFTAKVIDIRDEGDPEKSIIIVSCNQFNYDLVQHRCENVELIKGEYSGLKVPREAIRFKEIEEVIKDKETGIETQTVTNYKGVYILEGEQVEFRKLDVIYEGSDYVLSAVHEEDNSYLALYDDIMIEGVDSNGK
ncbi:MAG: hypothetical protein IJO99_03890 [Ruminococcus sp.]|nr:hypothetical protein [Ruminococcus sp.]MBQ9956689.1 hypothetical protein [Ruminococcus sp.]MBR6792028.1 hypothetical protein [Ruminococcus sp.]